MGLLNRMKERCARLVGGASADGLGGYDGGMIAGPVFEAVLIREKGVTEEAAQRRAAADRYIVLVAATESLALGEAFMRLSDGAVFRVTEDTRDGGVPGVCTVALRRGRCERWAAA